MDGTIETASGPSTGGRAPRRPGATGQLLSVAALVAALATAALAVPLQNAVPLPMAIAVPEDSLPLVVVGVPGWVEAIAGLAAEVVRVAAQAIRLLNMTSSSLCVSHLCLPCTGTLSKSASRICCCISSAVY